MKVTKTPQRKTVVITGASRGIGKATAETFAGQGYNVLINYHKSEKEANHLYKSLQDQHFSAKLFKADVSKRAEVQAMIKFCAEEFGAIDVLVNNTGISQEKLFTEITDEDWDNMMAINLKSSFITIQEVLNYMLPQKRGKIINLSSIWGMAGASCEVHYSAAKAGIIGLTKALAKELGPSNIHVNCIAPGVIQTNMLSAYSEEELANLRENTPLMRLGSPMDIAHCVLFLASQQANFLTGQIISPNSGFLS